MVELLKTTFRNWDLNEDSVIFVIDVWDKETVELVSERMVVGGGANRPWTSCPDFDGYSETVLSMDRGSKARSEIAGSFGPVSTADGGTNACIS